MHIEPRLRVLLGPREAPGAHCGDSLLGRQTYQSSETRSISVVGVFFFFLARKIKRAGVRRRNVKFKFKTGARRLRVLSLY